MPNNFRCLWRSPWLPLVAGGLALIDALAIEPTRLMVRRIAVPLEGGEADRGDVSSVRLAQLSDLHVGGGAWRRETLLKAIDVCNQEELDLIAITGDFIGSPRHVETALELLASLRSDVPRLAVLGNHDHVYGAIPRNKLLAGLSLLGITVLRNRSVPVDLSSGTVWFAGVDDGYSMRDDLNAAMSGLPRDAFPRILLTHYPDVVEGLRPGQVQLSLAGHTHGGQIRLPIITGLVNNGHARTNYGYGLYRVNGNPLYVTSGLGMSGVPMRFRNPPELAIIELLGCRG